MKTYYWFNRNRLLSHLRIATAGTLITTPSHLRNSVNRAPLRRGLFLITSSIFAVLLLGLSPAIATAQTSVHGHGKTLNDEPFSDSEISVNASLDTDGVAHGTVVWVGGVTPRRPGGPADPWLIDVTQIIFDGNTAHVVGVVVHSVFPEEIGIEVPLDFTDNSGTGQPDEIGVFGGASFPIVAGNIIVR
jgi:hypothetical protein